MANQKIVIDVALCNACGECIKVCPMNCLEMMEDKAILKKEEDCLVCLSCEVECRVGAIRVGS